MRFHWGVVLRIVRNEVWFKHTLIMPSNLFDGMRAHEREPAPCFVADFRSICVAPLHLVVCVT